MLAEVEQNIRRNPGKEKKIGFQILYALRKCWKLNKRCIQHKLLKKKNKRKNNRQAKKVGKAQVTKRTSNSAKTRPLKPFPLVSFEISL